VPGAKKLQFTLWRIVSIIILLAGLYLLLIAIFETFQYWPYFKFFLICVMGLSFLIISYLIKH
jgi:hypothetical protein